MTLDELIAQCAARGLDWQITCGHGLNGLPSYTALVSKPGTGASVYGMRTRSGDPGTAPADALKGALTDCVGKLEVANHGKR